MVLVGTVLVGTEVVWGFRFLYIRYIFLFRTAFLMLFFYSPAFSECRVHTCCWFLCCNKIIYIIDIYIQHLRKIYVCGIVMVEFLVVFPASHQSYQLALLG